MTAGQLDHGRAVLVARAARLPVSGVVARRTLVVAGALVAVLLALGILSLSIGSYQLGFDETVGALLGTGDRTARLLVLEWRMPRLILAIGCGVALALSGAVFQSLTRNPLGSPDVIGFNAGSYVGALVVILVAGSGMYYAVAAGSIAGGLVTAGVVYALAWRRGVQGFRLIVVGIAVGAMLSAVSSYLLLRANTQVAMTASAWGAGSLSAIGYAQLLPFLIALVMLLPLLAIVATGLQQLELGDDAARSLGVAAEPTRLIAVVVGVALTAIVTATVGPISFIALVTPQIARRLTHGSGLGLGATALTGAVLLVGADLIAQRIAIPTGIVTVALGGVYFAWLLIRESKQQ